MTDQNNNFQGAFNKSREAVKSVFDFTSEKLNDGLKALGDLGQDAKDRFSAYIKSIMNDLPLLEKAGYQTVQFEVGVSFPPSMEIHFKKFKDLDEESMNELRTEFKDRKMFLLLLNALVKANNFQKSVSSSSFVSDIITIDITIPPEIKVKFKRKEAVQLPSPETGESSENKNPEKS